MDQPKPQHALKACVLLAAALTASCGADARADKAVAPPPAIVSVTEVKPENVAIFGEYAAQTFARDLVEVRGRVDGYIERRQFQVGSDVRVGQVLYILDRRPYLADLAKAKADLAASEADLEFAKKQVSIIQAQADVAQAEANFTKTQQDVTRLQPLVKEEAAPRQDLENAQSAVNANKANVDARKANLQQMQLSSRSQIDTAAAQVEANRALVRNAELNVEYATIRSPIAGRIGDSLVPVGGLVTKSAGTPLATIVPLDPIWVRFKVSEGEYLASQANRTERVPLELVLADNTVYQSPGRLENTVNQADAKTGTLEVQATFPNPRHILLPGQFGRIRFRVKERQNALTVPQRAVQELQGLQSVMTVGNDNKVVARNVVPGERVGDRWIIEQGLKPGDKVIVEGGMKVRPGSQVTPQPYNSATKAPSASTSR